MIDVKALPVILLILTSVKSRELIIPTGDILVGVPFTIHCDAARFDLPEKPGIRYVNFLEIAWKPWWESDDKYIVLAQYDVFDRKKNYSFKSPPPDRDWDFTFVGNHHPFTNSDWNWASDMSLRKRLANIDTMKMAILVRDAQSQDAGTYRCEIRMTHIGGFNLSKEATQEVTAKELDCGGTHYGINCEHRCHCLGGAPCLPYTGDCPAGCDPDYHGPLCKCQYGHWGLECSQACTPECIHDCDPDTGECPPGSDRELYLVIGVSVALLLLAVGTVALSVNDRRKLRATTGEGQQAPFLSDTSDKQLAAEDAQVVDMTVVRGVSRPSLSSPVDRT